MQTFLYITFAVGGGIVFLVVVCIFIDCFLCPICSRTKKNLQDDDDDSDDEFDDFIEPYVGWDMYKQPDEHKSALGAYPGENGMVYTTNIFNSNFLTSKTKKIVFGSDHKLDMHKQQTIAINSHTFENTPWMSLSNSNELSTADETIASTIMNESGSHMYKQQVIAINSHSFENTAWMSLGNSNEQSTADESITSTIAKESGSQEYLLGSTISVVANVVPQNPVENDAYLIYNENNRTLCTEHNWEPMDINQFNSNTIPDSLYDLESPIEQSVETMVDSIADTKECKVDEKVKLSAQRKSAYYYKPIHKYALNDLYRKPPPSQKSESKRLYSKTLQQTKAVRSNTSADSLQQHYEEELRHCSQNELYFKLSLGHATNCSLRLAFHLPPRYLPLAIDSIVESVSTRELTRKDMSRLRRYIIALEAENRKFGQKRQTNSHTSMEAAI